MRPRSRVRAEAAKGTSPVAPLLALVQADAAMPGGAAHDAGRPGRGRRAHRGPAGRGPRRRLRRRLAAGDEDPRPARLWEHATAGRTRLGRITRAGDGTRRSVRVVGATAAVRHARTGRGQHTAWSDGRSAPGLGALLTPKPFSNRASFVNRFLLAAVVVVAVPGSRFSPRSARAAATPGPKHRRCNVHNGLTCTAHGPTASLAASLHPRPGGQLAPAPACRASGSRKGLVRRPRAAPTSGTARLSARCCAGSRTACGPAPRAPCRGRTASQPPAPVLQRRGPLDPRQDHDGRLMQQRAGQRRRTAKSGPRPTSPD